MRKFIFVGLLAFAVALSGTAYAEVQNIKVGGDINVKGIIHNNYDLKDKNVNIPGGGASGGGSGVTNDDNSSFLLSTVHLTVDADLTDNVSTHVRILNQRIWDATTASTDDINIDTAYVVLKEFLYSPLTVMVGRQDLNYGTGFIVGPGLLADPNAVFSTGITTGSQAQIGQEYSAYNTYDAVRAILDFAPVTFEAMMAKINETGVATDDQTLYGVIVNYKMDQWNAEVEPYWFYKDDEGAALALADSIGTTTFDVNRVHTFGLRMAGSPIENLHVNVEGATQRGKLYERTLNIQRDREAYAANVDVRYTWASVPMTPVTGFGWVYYSGEKGVNVNNPSENQQQSGSFNSWDVMYRGQFTTYIQDFLAGFNGTGLYATLDANDTSANTNRHLFYGDVSFKPMEDVTLWGRYTHVRFAQSPVQGRSAYAGDEIDVKAKYAYTDDVDLALGTGFFIPGTYYDDAQNSNLQGNDIAYTIVGEANVKF